MHLSLIMTTALPFLTIQSLSHDTEIDRQDHFWVPFPAIAKKVTAGWPKRRRHAMKMMLNAILPHEPFNTLVREGKAGEILPKIIDEIRPESVYFSEQDGKRSAYCVIELADPSEIPKFAEPFFLNFNADCAFRVLMSPTDLKNAGLADLGQKWA